MTATNKSTNLLWRLSCRAEREEEERHARALQAQIERAAELGSEAEEAVNNVSVLERQVCIYVHGANLFMYVWESCCCMQLRPWALPAGLGCCNVAMFVTLCSQ